MKLQNITGQRFGSLTVLEATGKYKHKDMLWKCQCDCGVIIEETARLIKRRTGRACGCISGNYKDITGQRYGKLVALRLAKVSSYLESKVWECQCDCGNIRNVPLPWLNSKVVTSCGCGRMNNLTGQRFGNLTVLRPTKERHGSAIVWECQCDCGAIVNKPAYYLKSTTSKFDLSCGCMLKQKSNLTGQRFGQLTVISQANQPTKRGSIIWKCRCDCGNELEATKRSLKGKGGPRSCSSCSQKRRSEIMKNTNIMETIGIFEHTSIPTIMKKEATKRSTTGVRGVSKNHKSGKFKASIGFQKITYQLGTFDTLEEATNARKKAEKEIYEPFLKKYAETYDTVFSKKITEEYFHDNNIEDDVPCMDLPCQ